MGAQKNRGEILNSQFFPPEALSEVFVDSSGLFDDFFLVSYARTGRRKTDRNRIHRKWEQIQRLCFWLNIKLNLLSMRGPIYPPGGESETFLQCGSNVGEDRRPEGRFASPGMRQQVYCCFFGRENILAGITKLTPG
jgi:hypothetical protein